MELAPVQRGMPLVRERAGWPAGGGARAPDRSAEVARQFETLIAATLLRSSRAAKLGDDGLGAAGDSVRDLVDRQRAEAIARAAPIGVVRLLATETGINAVGVARARAGPHLSSVREMGPRIRGGDGLGSDFSVAGERR